MGSTHTYDMTSGSGGGGGGQKAGGGGGGDIALNPDELDLNDTEAMAGLVTNTLSYSVKNNFFVLKYLEFFRRTFLIF